MFAIDVSPWLRSDAATSAERLFCHVHGRGRDNAQMIPGWPYSFVAALESGRTWWTALLDAVRIGPGRRRHRSAQLRALVERLIAAGQWQTGDLPILIVADSGYGITRLAFVLTDLPVELLGRIRMPTWSNAARHVRAHDGPHADVRHGASRLGLGWALRGHRVVGAGYCRDRLSWNMVDENRVDQADPLAQPS